VNPSTDSVLPLWGVPNSDAEADPKAAETDRHTPDEGLASLGEYLHLAHRLFVSSGVSKTVLFCGAEPGAGCSWVCARTAIALARLTPLAVCVVDANLRSPTLHEAFGVEPSLGLTDYVAMHDDLGAFVRNLGRGRPSVLPCGSRGVEVHSVFYSPAFRRKIERLKAAYSYVLVDGGPGSLNPGASQFAGVADGAVLVLGSSSARREEAMRAKQALEVANIPVLGGVLNKCSGR